jgi:hypothetical protein
MQSLILRRTTANIMARSSSIPLATFSTKKGPLDGKEKGDEKRFFDKEDQQALKKLLKKLQEQEKVVKAEEKEVEKHEEELKKVFLKHKIDDKQHKDFFEALIDWRKKI